MRRNRAKAVFFRSAPWSIVLCRIRCLWAPKNYVNAIECGKDLTGLASRWGAAGAKRYEQYRVFDANSLEVSEK